ncbi:hypothetical protein ABW20_dc0103212 [Dactylellina cionopaga]|nr:hypothetical protein ABW20_dc0103212 [Dactylellina cionopaga]
MSTVSKKNGKREIRWFDQNSCCFGCYQPTRICETDGEGEEEDRKGQGCRYKDILLPACFEAFQDKEWVRRHLPKIETAASLKPQAGEITEEEYFKWLGKGALFSNVEGHNGCFILEDVFRRFL